MKGIHSRQRFREIIDRERARADRTGIGFSLVLFRLEERNRKTYRTLYKISVELKNRSRTSDELGWYDQTSIGAILLGTELEGGRFFGSKILAAVPCKNNAPTVEVYSYPGPKKEGIAVDPKEARKADPRENAVPAGIGAEPAKVSHETGADDSRKTLPPVFAHQLPLWKDVLDVLAAIVALTLLSPLFLIIAAYIKIVSPGPVFFKQERIGFRGKRFFCWKFRTMKPDNNASIHQEYLKSLIREGHQPMSKLDEKRDPRIIPLGGVLRQSGLDELPQLINVIKGDMSLVGPRPCLPYEAEEYDRWHTERFDTAPGLTGLWQVSGKNRTSFKDMVRFDIRYAKRMSLWAEIWILFMTFPAIIQQIRDHRAKSHDSKGDKPIRSGKENA